MKSVWKYPWPGNMLGPLSQAKMWMPEGAKIVRFGLQHGSICLWAEVSTLAESTERSFSIYGTGHQIPEDVGPYIGTVSMLDDSLVLHCFEVTT